MRQLAFLPQASIHILSRQPPTGDKNLAAPYCALVNGRLIRSREIPVASGEDASGQTPLYRNPTLMRQLAFLPQASIHILNRQPPTGDKNLAAPYPTPTRISLTSHRLSPSLHPAP